jgi:hypothetical protein
MTRGWLVEGRTRLAAHMPDKVKSTETFGDFHVVHLDPEGFVVTSADDGLEPVIAFSAKGHFEANPENPLWVLLNRDVPERTAHIRAVKGRHNLQAALGSSPASSPDADVLHESDRSKAKWERFRSHTSAASRSSAPANSGVNFALPPPPGGGSNAVSHRTAVRIKEFRLVDGQVQITHDSLSSVSILASYDAGNSWQTLDSGVFQSTWISSRATRESACWFRVEEDGLIDEMTVGFMRNPPPALEPATDMVGLVDTNVISSEPLSSTYVSSVSDVRIAPLVQSKWSQSSAQGYNCYNYYTPNNYVCGCVATAVAQLLRYWQYPVAGVGQIGRTVYVSGSSRTATTRGGNGTGGPYTWSAMPLVPGSTTYNAAQWQMIGALCYDAGVSVNMQYSSGGSGAYMSACAGAFTGVFGYANAKYNYPPNLLQPINSNLKAGCPVLLGIDNSGASGHAIVCDGFGYSSGTMYHHLNMGWAGSWDLWYTLPAIGGPYNWNSVHCVIFNVFPTGAGELISGRVATTAGVPVQGANLTASASGQNYTATSDANGYYGIKVPVLRTYSVTASKTGMNSATRSGVNVGSSSYSVCGNAADMDFALSSFALSAVAVSDSIWLRWSIPTNCSLPNNTVYIRHRTDRYPTSASDGTEIYSGTSQVFAHTVRDTSGAVTNYYAIWGNDGSPYAAVSGVTQASACADPGTVKLFWTCPTATRAVAWLLKSDGTRRSSGLVGEVASGWQLVGTGDVDRDGVADLIWHNASAGKANCWLLNADGTKRSGGTIGDVAAGWTLAGVGDVDGDGSADLIWYNAALGKANYWFLNAGGTKRSGGTIATDLSTGWLPIGAADIDGDGNADMLWYQPTLGKTLCWFLNADGTRRSSVSIGDFAGGWKPVGIGNIDGDHVPDLIWFNTAQAKANVWFLNTSGTKRSAVSSGTAAVGWTLAYIGDINADGTADLIWNNPADGRVVYWILNADGVKRSSGTSSTASTGWNLSGFSQ